MKNYCTFFRSPQFLVPGKAAKQLWGVEFKYADAPTLTKSMRIAVQDLALSHLWIIYPGNDTYMLAKNVSTLPLTMLSDFKVFS